MQSDKNDSNFEGAIRPVSISAYHFLGDSSHFLAPLDESHIPYSLAGGARGRRGDRRWEQRHHAVGETGAYRADELAVLDVEVVGQAGPADKGQE